MKAKTLLLLALLAPLFTVPALADNPVEVNGLYYNLVEEGKTATVTKNEKQGRDDEGNAYTYSDYSGSVIIPSTITIEESGTAYTVVGIENEAFLRSNVTSVVIPNSVTSIGKNAFFECKSLASITLSNSITSIPEACFLYCYNLTSISIPESVTDIGEYAFSYCGFTSVTIPNSVTRIDLRAFHHCGSLTSVFISESVTNIESEAFSSCLNLTSIIVDEKNSFYDSRNSCNAIIETASNTLIQGCSTTIIPSSVAHIGGYAFIECNITSISIPESVVSIDPGAFQFCTNLVSVNIPESVTELGACAFCRTALTSITIPSSVTEIGEGVFGECYSLASITIPESVEHIESNAFHSCWSLSSIVVEEGNRFYDSRNGCNAIIETASNNLMLGCLTTIIPSSVTSIGSYAFSGYDITSITIPESVTLISAGAFGSCTNLASVNIPESVTEIGAGAFDHTALTSIIIPSSVTSIGRGVFFGCSNLTSIVVDKDNKVYDSRDNCNGIIETSTGTLIQGCQTTLIPNSVTCIGEWAFYQCGSPASIILPESVTNIDDEAFFGCGNLTAVTIPNSVTSIGKGAFQANDNLTSVVSLIQEPFSFGENAFTDICGDCILTVPFGTKEAYIAAGWTEEVFKGGIVEADPVPVTVPVTLGNAGVATFCCEEALDFSGTEDVKAYIVSAFRPSTGNVTLTRITDVPAGTGVVLLGNAGTYDIPLGAGETIVSNLLVGVTSSKTLNKVEGANTNFILADGENGIGFYTVVDGSTLAAGKAYLSLPTAALPSNAQSIGLPFDGTTGIRSMENRQWTMDNEEWFTIDGRRLDAEPTAKGLYIVNGRKVFVK